MEDYDQAQWLSRQFETVAIGVEFAMAYRLIGERKTGCTAFVYIEDEEFRFLRQPARFTCDQFEPGFVAWAQTNAFTSPWKLPTA